MRETHQGIFHKPILLNESLKLLLVDPSGVYVDGTMGGGGHSEAILTHLNKKGKLVGIDRDGDAVAHCRERFHSFGARVHVVKGEFGKVDRLLAGLGFSKIHGFFLDLGVSSFQIDTKERGFSYLSDGPLDMRMDSSALTSAKDVIHDYSESHLEDIFFRYGEERYARRIARKIVEERKKRSIETTGALADLVRSIIPSKGHLKTLSRIWQAIRIEVNDEISQLKEGLERIIPFMIPGGRIVVLSYESLSDRLVKRFFRGEEPTFSRKDEPRPRSGCCFRVLTRRVVRPTEEEVRNNPRARSARLRAAERVMDSHSRNIEP